MEKYYYHLGNKATQKLTSIFPLVSCLFRMKNNKPLNHFGAELGDTQSNFRVFMEESSKAEAAIGEIIDRSTYLIGKLSRLNIYVGDNGRRILEIGFTHRVSYQEIGDIFQRVSNDYKIGFSIVKLTA